MVTKRILWALCGLLPVLVLFSYVNTSTRIHDGAVVMPLDDVYIHFQYARAVAEGTPYVYNIGEPPTSGATSFIYPFILGIGYAIGFTGLNLGLWAMGIGAVMLGISLMLILLLTKKLPNGWRLVALLCFAGNGAIAWHFQSGMETGIIITMTLATFTALMLDRPRWVALCAGMLALIRPEGSIMAVIVAVIYGGNLLRHPQTRKHALWMCLPLIALTFQPIVNWWITGTFSASGNQAKSILGIVPFDWGIAIERITDNVMRMWREFFTDGRFTLFVLPLMALWGWVMLMRQRPTLAWIIAGWFIAVSGAISTLDTAFWHFKRYQMPLIALFYPLAVVGIQAIWSKFNSKNNPFPRHLRYGGIVILTALILMTIGNFREFLRLYAVNVRNVVAQPLPMAYWLRENTPLDATIAVHDVGIMRYIGERHTLDMVGLTSPDATDYWRHGPGAVGEWLLLKRPDYIAAYTTARGLNYLVDTPLYNDGSALAEFSAVYAPADNVAVGAEFQGIYRVDWDAIDSINVSRPLQPSLTRYLDEPIAQINVADLASEALFDYQWESNPRLEGFATEFYTLDYIDCEFSPCRVTDGGRRITDFEAFTVTLPQAAQSEDLILVTRLHPTTRGTFTVYANDQPIGTRQIIQQSGQWVEVATLIPAVNSPTLHIRLEPDAVMMPYFHWIYTASDGEDIEFTPLASYQDEAMQLTNVSLNLQDGILFASLDWWGNGASTGDYKLFVHVYDSADNPPIAQADTYSAGGTLPPANWLKGMIYDEIMVDLRDVASGQYRVAIGFYEASTFERLTPQSTLWPIEDNRLFIGEIDVP